MRVHEHEEVIGLDKYEHGIESSYADFMLIDGKRRQIKNFTPLIPEAKNRMPPIPTIRKSSKHTACCFF